jgi:DNA-binding LacI/PurR family transcriptional regulator
MPRKRARSPASQRPGSTLERDSAVPLYHQLAVQLEGELASGRFVPGARYHTDRDLVARTGLSLLTVRQAVSTLVERGLIERRHGSGTYVGGKLPRHDDGAILFAGWSLASLSSWDAMYFHDVYRGVCTAAERAGLRVLMDDPALSDPTGLVTRMRGDGIRGAALLVGSRTQERARQFTAAGLRVVTMNAEIPGVPSVRPDDRQGALAAVKHLWDLGHRQFVHLSSGEDTPHWALVRDGYREAIKHLGLQDKDHPVLDSPRRAGSIDAGGELAGRLLALARRPTAVVCGNDLMAIGALNALRQGGIDVPRQMSVIGFDDIAACTICAPPLTTIAADRAAIGAAAVEMLLEQSEPISRLLPVGLTLRASTAPPP